MKKKIIALALSLAMCLGMGTTALAAPSPVVPGISDPSDVTMKPWGDFNMAESRAFQTVFGDLLDSTASTADEVAQRNEKTLEVAKKYAGITGYEKADVIAYYNLGAPKDVDMSKGIDIALTDVPAVKYDKFIIIHITSNGNVESIPTKVIGGKIVGTFTSLSPVVIIGLKDPISSASVTTSTATEATATVNGSRVELIIENYACKGATDKEIAAYEGLLKPLESAKTGEEQAKYMNETLKKHGIDTTCEKINWIKEANVSLPEGVNMPAAGIDVTIKDSAVSAKDQIVLLHIKSDGTIEQIKNVRVADGSITGHFYSLSPVIYFSVEGGKIAGRPISSSQPSTGTLTGSGAQPSASPKTGEQGNAAPFCLAGMMVVCGAVYFGRKRFHA